VQVEAAALAGTFDEGRVAGEPQALLLMRGLTSMLSCRAKPWRMRSQTSCGACSAGLTSSGAGLCLIRAW